MNQNDYVILCDEKGTPYIAHAGWFDNARNAARNAANAVGNAAQQVANRAKGVGRGVRTNHKYILKVNENGKTRYFYKPEEVKAYYEAKRKGIKNPAEYAQKAADAASNAVDAVKNAASKAVDTARNAVREATGQAARDRMDEAANRRDTEAANMQINKQNREASRSNVQSARQATREAEAERNRSEAALKGLKEKWKSDNEKAVDVSSKAVDALTRKYAAESKARKADLDSLLSMPWEFQKRRDAKTVQADAWREAQQAENERKALHDEHDRIDKSRELTKKAYNTELEKSVDAWNQRAQALRNQDTAEKNHQVAQDKFNESRAAYREADSDYNQNKAAYDKSLAGAVDRTAARAREVASDARDTASSAYNKAKDAANNTVSNAKNAYERMKGEFRDRAEQAGNAVKSTAKNAVDKAKDIAGYDEKERLDKATENRQSTKDAARKGEQYVTDVLNESYPGGRTQTQNQRLNAAVDVRNERWDAEDKARDEYYRARADYNKTPLAMVNRAKEAASSVADSVRDTAKDAAKAVTSIPKAVKNAAEDVAFNAEYYSEQLKEGITGEKAAKMAANIREEAKDWKRRADQTKDSYSKEFFEQQYQKAEDFAKRFDDQAAKSLKGRVNSAANAVQGMIDNARSSTAKAVNEAWDKIPKNADGTVNPFDPKFQSTYNDWKNRKDKYDNSLTGRAKEAAERATDSVMDMIDQAKKSQKNRDGSAEQGYNDAIDFINIASQYRKEAEARGRGSITNTIAGHTQSYSVLPPRDSQWRKDQEHADELATKINRTVNDYIKGNLSLDDAKQKVENYKAELDSIDFEQYNDRKVRTPSKADATGRARARQFGSDTASVPNADASKPKLSKADAINMRYDAVLATAKEAGIDVQAYKDAVKEAELTTRRLMKEYDDERNSPGIKSLNSKMFYEDPQYKATQEKVEEAKLDLLRQIYRLI